MEAALFPPMAAHILLIFVGAISMVALVGIAYNYSLTRSTREKIARVEELERDVKILQCDIKALQDRLPKDAMPDNTDTKPAVDKAAGGALAGNVKQEVWQGFVDDYNNLANSMNIPKAAEACENFVRNNKVQLLVCVESQKAEDGKTLVYTAVDNVESSRYWAWNVTGKPDYFGVSRMLEILRCNALLQASPLAFPSGYPVTSSAYASRYSASLENRGGTKWPMAAPTRRAARAMAVDCAFMLCASFSCVFWVAGGSSDCCTKTTVRASCARLRQ